MKGWRTVIFNSIFAVLGVLEATDWIDIVSPEMAPIIVAIVGIVNVVLRKYTNTPIGTK